MEGRAASEDEPVVNLQFGMCGGMIVRLVRLLANIVKDLGIASMEGE